MALLEGWHRHNRPRAVAPTHARLEQQRRTSATKFEMRTPRYTTQVEALPIAQA
jgi:DNA polymerase V